MSDLENSAVPSKFANSGCGRDQRFTCENMDLEVYSCPHCNFSTDLKVVLKKHIGTCHTVKRLNKRPVLKYLLPSYKCTCCFWTHSLLVFLKHTFHCNPSHTQGKHNLTSKHTSEEKIKWFVCDQCEFKTKQRHDFQKHLKCKCFCKSDLCFVLYSQWSQLNHLISVSDV